MSDFDKIYACEGCGSENSTTRLDRLCPTCREALEVGRLVLAFDDGLPSEKVLAFNDGIWFCNRKAGTGAKGFSGKTATEAMQKAVKG